MRVEAIIMSDTLIEKIERIEALLIELNSKIDNFFRVRGAN